MNYPHSGHRERLRKRFLKSEFKGFNDYEVLELLLTYVIPRRDTKPLAKRLIKQFKSLPGVLKAEISELEKIEGIGENAAIFIKIIQETIRFQSEIKAQIQEIRFTKRKELVEYLKATIGNKTNEIVRVLYLNSRNQLIDVEDLSEGTVNESVVFPRKVVEGALKHHATSVILAHNHPGGLAEPSDKDDKITQQIKSALQTVGISLQDHLVIAGDECFSYRKTGFLE